jgi:hypothetical protein
LLKSSDVMKLFGVIKFVPEKSLLLHLMPI